MFQVIWTRLQTVCVTAAFKARKRVWTILQCTEDWRAASTPTRLAIGGILKDEGPYLLEWIAWHRCLGIHDFFLADNGSTDGMTELLFALDKAGIATRIDFPGPPDKPPQLPAYIHIADTFGALVDWIAFIDADEFIQPLTLRESPAKAVQSWLAALPTSVGAVAMNWVNYGSSGRTEPGTGLVVERFTHRAPQDLPENNHMKSIVRMRSWQGALGTPHGFAVVDPASYIDTAANPVSCEDVKRGRMPHAVWGSFRLNHYIIKSRSEFTHKKRPRGRPDSFTAKVRSLSFFDEVDRDNIEDAIDPTFILRVKTEMERLRVLLGTLDPAIRDMDLGPVLQDGPTLAAGVTPP